MKPGLEGRTKQNLFSLAAVVCHLSELFHFGKLNINFMIKQQWTATIFDKRLHTNYQDKLLRLLSLHTYVHHLQK